jgi:hypothetical protein
MQNLFILPIIYIEYLIMYTFIYTKSYLSHIPLRFESGLINATLNK